MYWLASLLALESALEFLLCIGGSVFRPLLRKALCVLAGGVLVGLSIALTVADWQLWVWVLPISGYRLINLLRVHQARLPERQLRTVTTRALGWLLPAQVVVALTAWVIGHFHLANVALDVLVASQLFSAVVLLRASTHTWRHAAVMPSDKHLSDKDLPTVSVLVPARNETESLSLCLQALIASNYLKLEVLVLDDCSANRHTPEIIRSFAHDGVRFVQGGAPDEIRWLPKNYAYDQLAREASGELLLFCGVDTMLAPDSIRGLVEILESRGKNMLSVMPLHANGTMRNNSLLQAVRYYWEICLPRRFFKRPPVLSTCWLIRREMLERIGGFESVSRSISPESAFARRAVATDAYSFIRSDDRLGVRSNKPDSEQYGTSVRVRYPQLHRRLELVALVSFFELVFLLGPLLGLIFAVNLSHTLAYVAMWVVALVCLFTTYGLVVVGARLSSPGAGWLLMPMAFVADLAMLHISLWKYEFSRVDWKGRNVCIPVMQVFPRLPGL